MKLIKWFSIVIAIGAGIYFMGPRPSHPELNTALPAIVLEVNPDAWIKAKELKQPHLKADNEARIVWFDSAKKKTPVSIVYIHGFSASQGEGIPLHEEFAKRYGCNLYLARLSQHGLNEKEPMLHLSAENMMESAKEAVAIGKLIGEKVIIMATSTGGTLALYLASGNPDIAGLILYSPNIDLYDSRSFILAKPWGLQLAELINGSKYYYFEGPEGVNTYWTTKYRIEALISLKQLLNNTMKKSTFLKIKQPVLVGYYPEDDQVSIPRMMEMFDELGTSGHLKRKISFPKSGHHCILSKVWSKDVEGVQKETFRFAEEVLQLKALTSLR